APGSLSFGNIYIGSNEVDTVTITNDGAYPLNVTLVASDNAHVSPNPASLTVPPLGSDIVVITVAPTTAGSQSANIIFTHEASSSPDTVAVTFTGLNTP